MTKINLKCVEIVRKIRDDLYLETKSMTDDELVEFYSKKTKKAENKSHNKCVDAEKPAGSRVLLAQHPRPSRFSGHDWR